jgi:hypothetical protein
VASRAAPFLRKRRYEDGLELMRAAGSRLVDRVRAIVVIEVRETRPVVSPAYDDGTMSEADIIQLWTSRITTR